MSEGPIQSLSPVALLPLAPSAPQVARQFPEPMALVLKVRLGAMPTVTLHTNNATLQLQPFVEVLAPASNSAFQSLFSLNVVSEVGWGRGLAGGVGNPQGDLTSSRTLLTCSALTTLAPSVGRTFLPQVLCTCHTRCLGHSSPGSWYDWLLLIFQVSA